MRLDPVLTALDEDLPNALERLKALVRIPSVSTDSAYHDACVAAADWLVDDLRSIGADVARHDTPGKPFVMGEIGEGAPHLMFYGHYDVQPVDPVNLWHRDPFDPAVEETAKGRVIRGRGTADDKGQLMTFVEACRAWVRTHGKMPCRITFFFEGEEESGSPSLLPFLAEHKARLSEPEIALICDTSMFDRETPAITTMLRGMVKEQFTVIGPDRDLHSGHYGGAAANPLKVLARLLAGLHDDAGRVTLPGFYDGVPDLADALREQWDGLGFDEREFLGDIGLSVPAGETGRSVLELTWSRPTCEINGIWGGYTGEGFKTVIPSEAHCKLSFRLVGQQDPKAIDVVFRAYVEGAIPPDCKVRWDAKHDGAPASVMPTDKPIFEAARRALSDEWPRPAAFIGSGGSIPIAGYFQSVLGVDSMLIGFGLDDDGLHSPNEKYDLASFHKGARSWARVLDAVTKD